MVHGHGPQCGEQDHDRKGYHDFSMVHAGLRPCQHVQDERHEKRDKQGVHDDDGKRKSNVAPIYAHPYQAGGTCRHQGNDDKPRDDLRIVENQPGNEPGTQRQSDIENDEMKEKLDIELEAPASFTSPGRLYADLIKSIRRYHPSDDISMIEKAYQIAKEAHKAQKRKSGEPYIIIPSVWRLFWQIWRWIRRR